MGTIENIWLYIKRELQESKANVATSNNDPFRAIQRVWQQIELDYVRKPYHSILDRLDNVKK